MGMMVRHGKSLSEDGQRGRSNTRCKLWELFVAVPRLHLLLPVSVEESGIPSANDGGAA